MLRVVDYGFRFKSNSSVYEHNVQCSTPIYSHQKCLLQSFLRYTLKVDVWFLGCVVTLSVKALFPLYNISAIIQNGFYVTILPKNERNGGGDTEL